MTYVIVILGLYGSYKYAPLFYKKSQLESVVREECYGSKRKSAERIANDVVAAAKRQLNIDLKAEDIDVTLMQDRIRIRANWRVRVEHPFDQFTDHIFTAEEEVTFY